MQNFLPGVGSTLLPEDPEALRLMRQRQMAEMLMAQGAQPIETSNRQAGRFVTPVSPLEGLAKLLQTGIGAYQQRKVDDRIQELGSGRRTALARLLRGEPAVGSVPAEEFEVDAEVNRTPPPFQGGNNTPVFARDPARQNILDVGAPPVNVVGRPQPQAAPQPDDPITAYKRRIADMLDTNAISDKQATQLLMGIDQLQVQREINRDNPLILPEGGTAVDRRGEVIARGAPKDRTFTAGGVVYDRQTNQPLAGRYTQREGDQEVTFEIRNGQPVEVARGKAFNDRALANVKVDNIMPGNKGISEGVNKSVQARIEAVNSAAASAPTTLTNVREMRTALDSGKVMIGPTTSVRMALRQISQMIGIGTDDEALARTQEVISGLAKITLANRESLRGQGTITDKETELLERAQSGNIDKLSVPQLRQILDAAERAAKYHISENDRYLELLKNNADPAEFMRIEDPTKAKPTGKGEALNAQEREELRTRLEQLRRQQGGQR
jgi:hypothetical protein